MQELVAYKSIVTYDEYLKTFTENRRKEKERLMKEQLELRGDVEIEIRKHEEPTMEQEQEKEAQQKEEVFHPEKDGMKVFKPYVDNQQCLEKFDDKGYSTVRKGEGKHVEVVQVLTSYDQLHGDIDVGYERDDTTFGTANEDKQESTIAPIDGEHISLHGDHKDEGKAISEFAKPA